MNASKLKPGDHFQLEGQVRVLLVHKIVGSTVFYRFNGHEYSCGVKTKIKRYKNGKNKNLHP
jgi:hypothetical protein